MEETPTKSPSWGGTTKLVVALTFVAIVAALLIRFQNIIILNGHGGNTSVLDEVMSRVSNDSRVRIMIINWWSVADDITKVVFHENGGHAADNETAYIQAVYPQHVHPERYSKEMVSVNPPKGSYLTAPASCSTSTAGSSDPRQTSGTT